MLCHPPKTLWVCPQIPDHHGVPLWCWIFGGQLLFGAVSCPCQLATSSGTDLAGLDIANGCHKCLSDSMYDPFNHQPRVLSFGWQNQPSLMRFLGFSRIQSTSTEKGVKPDTALVGDFHGVRCQTAATQFHATQSSARLIDLSC